MTNSRRETITPDQVWGDIARLRHLSPRFGLGIFEILDDVFEKHFKFKAKYPARVIIPKLPTQLSLFWASLFGELPDDVAALVLKRYTEPLDVETPEFEAGMLSDFFKSRVLFPQRLTLHQLQVRNRATFGRDASVFYMDATKTSDVVDFWNLRATGRSVLPVPRQLQDHPQVIVIVTDFLRRNRRPWPHDPTVCDRATIIRSRHTTMDDMEAWAKTLSIEPEPNDPSKDSFYLLQRWYPRVWDEWARDKDDVQPADAYGPEETIELPDISDRTIRFKPMLPEFAYQYGYSGKPRCANEVSFRFYGATEFLAEVFPTFAGDNLSRAISGLTLLRGDWRAGRHGLVKLVKDRISEAREIPLGETIMFAWLQDLGWTPKLSTPGLLAQQIYRQLDGYPQYVTCDEKLLGLFEHMNGGQVQSDGSPVSANKIGQERDLSIGEVKSRVGARLYNYLLSKGIFRLGVKAQCPRCQRHSWYPLNEIRDSLTCPRCLNAFPAVGHLDSATWSYKTAGPFSVPNYADGAYGVLAALAFFDDRKMHTMRTTSVLSFTAEVPDKKNIEADFAALGQESLYGSNSRRAIKPSNHRAIPVAFS